MTQAQKAHPGTQFPLVAALSVLALTAVVIAVGALAMLRPIQPAQEAGGVTQAADQALVEAGRSWQELREQQIPGTYAGEQAQIEAGREWQRQREQQSGTGFGTIEADHIPTAPGIR